VEDDLTNELLKETENAKVTLNQQDKDKNDAAKENNADKFKQIKKKQDQKFIDLMDDLDI
jgi:hypothetical protein